MVSQMQHDVSRKAVGTAMKLRVQEPTLDMIVHARLAAGLTQAQAAEYVHLSTFQRWSEYERGARKIDVAKWELFLLKTGLHPSGIKLLQPKSK